MRCSMQIGGIITVIAMTGCRGGDSLAGDWSGDLTCNDIEYEVEARFFEDSTRVQRTNAVLV